MIDSWLSALTLLAALGSGVVAGVFFAFSVFVMKALARLPAAQGHAAMQSINAAAINALFMATLFGTALACVVLLVASLIMWDEAFAAYLLAGSVLYLVGTILLTVVYHVPRNEALAATDPTSAEAASRWARFLAGWTAWNHVRTSASVAAAATLTVALRVG
jgi:uncharacterized membrane protein